MSLEVKKASSGYISPKILKTSSDICSPLFATLREETFAGINFRVTKWNVK